MLRDICIIRIVYYRCIFRKDRGKIIITIDLTKDEVIELIENALYGLKADIDNTEYEITENIINKQIKRYVNTLKKLKGEQ